MTAEVENRVWSEGGGRNPLLFWLLVAVSAAATLAGGGFISALVVFRSLGHQINAAVVGNRLIELGGEDGANQRGGGKSLHAREGRRHHHQLPSEFHNPEVEALEKVQAENLGLGAQDGAGLLRQGELVPRQDPFVAEGLTRGRDVLHDAIVGGLVGSLGAATVTAVLDELAPLFFAAVTPLALLLISSKAMEGTCFISV